MVTPHQLGQWHTQFEIDLRGAAFPCFIAPPVLTNRDIVEHGSARKFPLRIDIALEPAGTCREVERIVPRDRLLRLDLLGERFQPGEGGRLKHHRRSPWASARRRMLPPPKPQQGEVQWSKKCTWGFEKVV